MRHLILISILILATSCRKQSQLHDITYKILLGDGTNEIGYTTPDSSVHIIARGDSVRYLIYNIKASSGFHAQVWVTYAHGYEHQCSIIYNGVEYNSEDYISNVNNAFKTVELAIP